MERIMVVAYRPYKGKEEAFRSLLFRQIETYRNEGLLTDREPWFMQSQDGTYLGFFEWKSKAVVDDLAAHPKIQELWMQFEKICAFEKPSAVTELQSMFGDFKSLRRPQ